ncbi:hypothetical protein FOVG_01435 [Fusarium oxysporum f. sp. pisi HDV247]|uniref:Uncharacterized protein n=1 Tax=Fusarium oxysporum f. sp. pisi HDV247 TaxID=1080344 RepID=W9Q8A3_FUSOX|nr:hypothetical protein FOVG_01435 [Fusarium oxysporum f. sp. pisi HDV247]
MPMPGRYVVRLSLRYANSQVASSHKALEGLDNSFNGRGHLLFPLSIPEAPRIHKVQGPRPQKTHQLYIMHHWGVYSTPFKCCLTKAIHAKMVPAPHAVRLLHVQNLVLDVLSVLRNLPAVRFLPSKTNRGTLRSDVLRLISAAASDDFDYDQVNPLLKATLAEQPDDHDIWEQVYKAVAKSTPPPPAQQPLLFNKPHGCATLAALRILLSTAST